MKLAKEWRTKYNDFIDWNQIIFDFHTSKDCILLFDIIYGGREMVKSLHNTEVIQFIFQDCLKDEQQRKQYMQSNDKYRLMNMAIQFAPQFIVKCLMNQLKDVQDRIDLIGPDAFKFAIEKQKIDTFAYLLSVYPTQDERLKQLQGFRALIDDYGISIHADKKYSREERAQNLNNIINELQDQIKNVKEVLQSKYDHW